MYAVLSDGWCYPVWVVGASHMRAVDPGWPAPGTRLHHAVGAWPFVVRDTTSVTLAEPNRRLQLLARGWPAGEALVDLQLTPDAAGTTVTMDEIPASGPLRWVHNRLQDALIYRRNVESLGRLTALVEGRVADPLPELPSTAQRRE